MALKGKCHSFFSRQKYVFLQFSVMAPVPKKRPKSDANARKAKNECEQRRRDQIKSDPEKYEEFKRKERESERIGFRRPENLG